MAEVLDRLHDGVAVFDSDDNLIFANEVCRDLFRPIAESFTPGTPFAALMAAAGAKKMIADAFVGPGEIDLSDGRTVLLRESRMPSGGVVRTFTDLTEYRLAEQQIAYMASHDEVTGLPNRSLFHDRLDVSVARYGGDEFTVILNQISNAQDVSRVAQSIVEELTRPFTAKRETVMIGASVGIALYPEHSESADALVRIADKAMYEVKHAGKRGYRLATTEGR